MTWQGQQLIRRAVRSLVWLTVCGIVLAGVGIIDLGTKFDVDADADGTTNVLVRLGRVRVIPQGSRGEEDERLLTAGEREHGGAAGRTRAHHR